MGFKKEAAPVMDQPTMTASNQVVQGTTAPPNPGTLVGAAMMSADEKRVRGQVRMHALMAGYKVAAQLAPTLASTTAGIKEELHKVAYEVAAKIEEYSFL